MKARIYRPTRSAMQQSGQANNHHWVLEFMPQSQPFIDPLMGWTGMTDTTQELHLFFTSKEEAVRYATQNALEFEIKEPYGRILKPKSYAANFAFNRVIDKPESAQ